MREVVAILHNIRSIHNVASMFRTADGAGITMLYLTGFTPGPLDAFDRPVQQFTKVSLGAEQSVSWIKKRLIGPVVARLKNDGYTIIALELHPKALQYTTAVKAKKIAFIVGSEPKGLPTSVIKQCDAILEIPMRGKKESLNVSVAFGVAAYKLTD